MWHMEEIWRSPIVTMPGGSTVLYFWASDPLSTEYLVLKKISLLLWLWHGRHIIIPTRFQRLAGKKQKVGTKLSNLWQFSLLVKLPKMDLTHKVSPGFPVTSLQYLVIFFITWLVRKLCLYSGGIRDLERRSPHCPAEAQPQGNFLGGPDVGP